MSYCVNCGVELDPTARACPLCHTPVVNPNQPVDASLPPPFPSRREEVQPVSKRELALLLSAMLGSVAVCCGVLNLFFVHSGRPWSLYVIGAAAMLWIWLVVPLVLRQMPLWLRLGLDACAVGVYVYLISIDLHGLDWYLRLAVPMLRARSRVELPPETVCMRLSMALVWRMSVSALVKTWVRMRSLGERPARTMPCCPPMPPMGMPVR